MPSASELAIVIKAQNETTAVLKAIQRDLQQTETRANSFGASLKRINETAAGFIHAQVITRGLGAVKDLFGSSIGVATSYNETLSKSRTIFGALGGDIERFASTAATNLGLSKRATLDATGTFGNMFQQLRFGAPAAADMSKGMVQLAVDLASFHNADVTDVINAQTSAFRGEYDALQRYIPTINAASVQQVAMATTGKKNAASLTLQEKAAATYQIILRGAGAAQGDFARTSDSTANKNRILTASFDDLKNVLGQELEPTYNRVLGGIIQKLQDPAFQQGVRNWIGEIKEFASTFYDGFQRTIIPAFQWVISNQNAIVGAIGAIGLAFIWTNPVGAAFVGAGGLIYAVGLFTESLDTASDSSLKLRDNIIQMAKDGIGAFGELLKVMSLATAGPAINVKLFGVGGNINPANTIATRAIEELVKQGQTGIDKLLGGNATRSEIQRRANDPSYHPQGYGPPAPGLVPPGMPQPPPFPDLVPPLKDNTEALKSLRERLGETIQSLIGLDNVSKAVSALFGRPTREQADLQLRQAEQNAFKARFGEKAVRFGPGEGPGTGAKVEKQLKIMEAEHDVLQKRITAANTLLISEQDLAKEAGGLRDLMAAQSSIIKEKLNPGINDLYPEINTAYSGFSALNGVLSGPQSVVENLKTFARNLSDFKWPDIKDPNNPNTSLPFSAAFQGP